MAQAFDVSAARSHFPALSEKQVYFDNAGGSQVLREVIDSITNYLCHTNVQMGGTYAVGKQSTKLFNEGMEAAARFINAGPDEIVLGSSTTQLMRNLSSALSFPPGSELILSLLDHEANIAPWVQIATTRNLTIKWWGSTDKENPKLTPETLKPLLSAHTRLVACTHTSNILGTIHDIKAIAATVHTVPGAMLCVDGVAYAPHRGLDVKALGVDFYAFSWYKVYGPHMSMLYAARAIHPQIHSLGHYFNAATTLEDKLGLAGSNYELTASIPKVVSYLGPDPAAIWARIATHEEKLQGIILGYLNSNKNIVVYGARDASKERRVPVISFGVRGRSAKEVVEKVQGRSDFGFKSGHFYSKRLLDEVMGLGEEGVLRVSLVHYNTEEEAAGFVKVLKEVLAEL
ncbi:hypothetical protein MMC18_002941 [Xylographa bjoerkii]|nr:hypothetical protein [Xylographa bjoerkii]